MIEILSQSSESNVGFKVSGKIIREDYDVMLPRIDEAIEAYGRINLVVVMGDFEGWSGMEAAKADFQFGKVQYHQVEKAAFVGDKKWQKWMIKIMDPFTRRTDERFFDLEQLDDAWQWITEGD